MGPGGHERNGLKGDTEINHALVMELALSAGPAIAWWFDVASETFAWLPGLDDMLGLAGADEQIVRARLADLLAPVTIAARTAPVWQEFELEQPCETPGGVVRWLQFRARVSSTGPDHRSLVGIATDISGRRDQEQALTDLADRYRLLVDLAPEGIVVHQAGRLVYANPAAVRFVGAGSPADLLGKPIVEFVAADSVPAMLQRISGLTVPGATSEPADAALVRTDGGTIDVESVSVRTMWEGQPAYQVIMRDVTADKAAAAALRYQAALVTHVSDALIATTVEGTVTSWNPSAETVYGHTARDAIGRPLHEVVGAALDPAEVLGAGGVVQAEHRRPDGTGLAVRVSVARMTAGYVLICADETARRRAEQYFTTVVAAIEEGVIVVGPTGLIESVNPAAERILGIRTDEVMGTSTSVATLYDEDGEPIPLWDFPSARTRRTGQPQNGRVLCALRPDGTHVWLSMSCSALNPPGDLPTSVVISFTDITERRRLEARREHEATHDALTGLGNRTVVIDQLGQAARSRIGATAILFIDLDKFKVINDSLGHGVGDRVLRIVGARLRGSTRRGDVVGRLGGDEFAIIAHDVTGREEATELAIRIRDELNRPVAVDGRNLHIDASIGIVLVAADDPRTGGDLLRDADLAMYQAKTEGRGRHAFFDVDLREQTQRRLQLEQDLRQAPERGQLWLVYQPIVDLRTGRTAMVEGLLRWTHPRYGLISPGEFIPLAEESDLIDIIGAHMLSMATEELAGLRAGTHPDLRLTVNLSARQLDNPRLVDTVRTATAVTGLPPSALCLEITESALMRDPAAAARTLAGLRALGAHLAIDDFGTGYSSLAQLLTLPLDTLKIDRTFVSGLGSSKDAEAIVTSIIAMAHAVNLTVVAEGVENEDQLDILRRLDCDQGQGYHLGRPVAATDLE